MTYMIDTVICPSNLSLQNCETEIETTQNLAKVFEKPNAAAARALSELI